MFAQALTYKYPSPHGYAYSFSGNEVRLVPIGNAAPEDAAKTSSTVASSPDSKPVHDCTTEELQCISSSAWVFAVPRGALTPGLAYEVAKARVKVLGCIPDTDRECAVAVLESICLVPGTRSDIGAENRAECRDFHGSSRLVYIYSKRRGILAFDEASSWPDVIDVSDWKLETLGTTAGMYALVNDKGIFAAR